ncbi:MAG: hypothetical protein AB7H90_18970 [Alphaproteobacteria bacterium]
MLTDTQIVEKVEKIAKSKLGRENVVRVFSEPGSGIDAEPLMVFTVVLAPDAADRITGDEVVDNLVAINDFFYKLRDERRPHLRYATEEELAAGDDPEC